MGLVRLRNWEKLNSSYKMCVGSMQMRGIEAFCLLRYWNIYKSTNVFRFSRRCFPQVWLVFNLDVHSIICVKFIYFRKNFHLNYDFKVNSIFEFLNSIFWIFKFQYLLKNSAEPVFSKSNLSLNKCTKTCK